MKTLLAVTILALGASTATAAAPTAAPRAAERITPAAWALARGLGTIPTFWTCIRFRTTSRPFGAVVTTFDSGALPTDDPDVQVDRVRWIREHGGEWLPGPEPLPHGVTVAQLEDVYVERWDEDRRTVCQPR